MEEGRRILESLCKPARIVPSASELFDEREMAQVFEDFADSAFSCFLDSSLAPSRFGNYSFIGFDPFLVLTTNGVKATFSFRNSDQVTLEGVNPLEALRMVLNLRRSSTDSGTANPPPFLCGGIGYLSYDLGRYIEKLPEKPYDDLELPELGFCFYDRIIAGNLATGKKFLVVSMPEGNEANGSLEETRWGISSARDAEPARISPLEKGIEATFSKDAYIAAVKRVKEYIMAGDIYQANLSQRFSAQLEESPWDAYKRLRLLNPAPFSAYLNFEDFQVASSSPERFLKVTGRLVETRPIKGTSPRSDDPLEDEELKSKLMGSEKDNAELSMIVDLERNDLGRVCEYGSVKVAEHAVLESYATVHHLVSTVVGNLREGKDVVDLIHASFPGGSITGAPKIRAMEIIDELEPTARGIYTGSIGWIGFDGNLDLNIAIRTAVIKENRVYVQVGGGIVADSNSESEYMETLHKGKAMFEALGFSREDKNFVT